MTREAWHNKESMTNVISLADMADDHIVTMDTSKDKSMLVHLPDKIVRFVQMENRPHGLSLNDPKRHLAKEEFNKNFNDDMPVLLSSNDDGHNISDDECDDDNSRAGKHKCKCKHDHENENKMKINKLKENSTQLLITVNENNKFLSDSQQAKAKKGRKTMKALGTPTVADLKSSMRMNLMKD